MNIIWDPGEIESRSMEIIEGYLNDVNLSPVEKSVVKRVIHTTGDPEITGAIRFHPRAVEAGLKALRSGAPIYTDVNMLKSGINGKRLAVYGGQMFCSISDSHVIRAAANWGITRAAAAIRLYGRQLDKAVLAIGNAPTALFEVLDLIRREVCRPAVIVGTPVGFVGAAESKNLLVAQDTVPYISLLGTRGGSPIAASMINALLYYKGDAGNG